MEIRDPKERVPKHPKSSFKSLMFGEDTCSKNLSSELECDREPQKKKDKESMFKATRDHILSQDSSDSNIEGGNKKEKEIKNMFMDKIKEQFSIHNKQKINEEKRHLMVKAHENQHSGESNKLSSNSTATHSGLNGLLKKGQSQVMTKYQFKKVLQSDKYYKRLLVEHKDSKVERSLRIIQKEVIMRSQMTKTLSDKDESNISDILSSSPHERIKTVKRNSKLDESKNIVMSKISNHLVGNVHKMASQHTPINKHIQKENDMMLQKLETDLTIMKNKMHHQSINHLIDFSLNTDPELPPDEGKQIQIITEPY
mmetsp:Transcript_8592/g.13300  ORF Transcript_8592/g.13300 Transcript_8592/m.13300 type:complete len:312 (+) Transcript_8592:203-1138(+)